VISHSESVPLDADTVARRTEWRTAAESMNVAEQLSEQRTAPLASIDIRAASKAPAPPKQNFRGMQLDTWDDNLVIICRFYVKNYYLNA